LAYLSDPNWHMVWGYKAVNGNYMQLKENVCRSGGQAARQAGQYGHTFLTPGANHGAVDVHDPHPEPGGLEHFKLRIIHLTTPVSIAKTHYYWAMARDHGAPFDYPETRKMADIVFGEDIAVVEATQAMAQRSIDQSSANEFSVTADRAAVEARRRVAAQVAAEKAAGVNESSVSKLTAIGS
jgi:hypothetical protein